MGVPAALLGGGIGASLLGSLVNNNAQQSAVHASAHDAKAEAARQQELQKKNLNLFGDSLGSYNSAAQQPQQAADAREAQVRDALAKAGPGLSFDFAGAGGPGGAMMGKEINDRANFGSAQVGRKAQLQGYGDADLNRNLAVGQNSLDIGLNNYQGQRSANTLGMELDADQSKAYSPLGDFLLAGGSAATGLGAMGFGAGRRTPGQRVIPGANGMAAGV